MTNKLGHVLYKVVNTFSSHAVVGFNKGIYGIRLSKHLFLLLKTCCVDTDIVSFDKQNFSTFQA